MVGNIVKGQGAEEASMKDGLKSRHLRLSKMKLVLILSSLLVLNACSTIVAENSCGAAELTPLELQQTFGVGKDLETALNRLNNEVIILARSGQDLEKYGIRYSHAAFMVKEQSGWQVYHLLNECPSSAGGLYQEGLGNFVQPVMANRKLQDRGSVKGMNHANISFGYVIPSKQIQRDLKHLLQDSKTRNSVFEKQYSAVANPYNLLNQNSNGWVLELYSIAEAKTKGQMITNREAAQTWLKSQGYQGTELPASILKQRLAAIAVGNVSLKGHERADRYQGKLLINSGDSVLNYIGKHPQSVKCANLPSSSRAKDTYYCDLELR